MDNQYLQINYGEELLSWEVPEFEKHERTKRWYIISIVASLLLMLFAFLTSNFLFAVIIIIAALIVILRDGQEPEMVRFIIATEGVVIGRKFYDYDEIKDFAVVYKPNLGIKNIYFEFKTVIKPRLSIPLINNNPLPIREILLKYLPEDLERTDQPVSEALGKTFKL